MDFSTIIMLVAFFAVMYFFVIRPENKKDKAVKEMRNNLQIGDEIMTIGGICGKIVSVKDDRVIIRTGSDNIKLEMAKESIGQKIGEDPNKKVKEKEKASPKTIKKLGEKKEAAKEEAPAAEPEVKAEATEVQETATEA